MTSKQWDPNNPDRLHATGWGTAPRTWKASAAALVIIAALIGAWLIFGR